MLCQDQCYCLSLRSIYFQFSAILVAPHVRSSAAMPSWKWFHKITGGAEKSDHFLYRMYPPIPQMHGLQCSIMPTISELFPYCLLGLRFKRRLKKHCTGPKNQDTPFAQVKVHTQLSRSNRNSRAKLLFQGYRLKVITNLQLMRTEDA